MFKKIFSVHNLVILGGMIISIALSFIIVNSVILPKALKEYGIESKTDKQKSQETNKDTNKENTETKEKSDDKKESKKHKEIGPTVSIGPIVVNIAGSEARRFLKTVVVLELSDPKLTEELEKRSPQINNLLIELLPDYTIDEITSGIGKEKIRKTIQEKINTLLAKGKIVNVYLSELVVQ